MLYTFVRLQYLFCVSHYHDSLASYERLSLNMNMKKSSSRTLWLRPPDPCMYIRKTSRAYLAMWCCTLIPMLAVWYCILIPMLAVWCCTLIPMLPVWYCILIPMLAVWCCTLIPMLEVWCCTVIPMLAVWCCILFFWPMTQDPHTCIPFFWLSHPSVYQRG